MSHLVSISINGAKIKAKGLKKEGSKKRKVVIESDVDSDNSDQLDIKKTGTRKEVFEGQAVKTKGGLHKEDLYKNERGKLVSVKASEKAKENWAKNAPRRLKRYERELIDAGYKVSPEVPEPIESESEKEEEKKDSISLEQEPQILQA